MPDNPKILVVDDEEAILDLISYNLSREGFDVSAAATGEEALKRLRGGSIDLVILDLMMPGMQGSELCRVIRSTPETEGLPIIMVTAKTEEVDRVLGLEMGADDYVTKPFSTKELTARVRAVLRRSEKKTVDKLLTIGDLVINLETYVVSKHDRPIHLSATEFKLLAYLAERKGRIFNRDRLLEAIWKDESVIEPRTVDVHIRRLRMQIEDDPANPAYLKTLRGVGYFLDTSHR